jgi:hypothetical protein
MGTDHRVGWEPMQMSRRLVTAKEVPEKVRRKVTGPVMPKGAMAHGGIFLQCVERPPHCS